MSLRLYQDFGAEGRRYDESQRVSALKQRIIGFLSVFDNISFIFL
jgi:hypothetical protein